MKELSIEEKAKAHDEALERAKSVIEQNPLMEYLKKGIEYIFPELKENNDEKIRKALINGFNKLDKSAVWYNGITNGQVLDWLEKQGEQKPADKVEPKFKAGDRVIGIVSGMQYFITKVCDDHYNTESGCIIMFCSQNNFELYKQKPAWSEEDEEHIKSLLERLEGMCKKDATFIRTKFAISEDEDWLKSLSPQSRWKPSNEQMVAIDTAINVLGKGTLNGKQLIELQEQLKKLKG